MSIGWLFAMVLLCGSCHKEVEPYDGWDYNCQIYIDSTAASCEVDSCVLNLPWLRSKIEQAIADTAVIPYIEDWEERWDAGGRLEIYQYVDTITDAYYFAFIDYYPQLDTTVYDCSGNVTRYSSNHKPSDIREIADIWIEWHWWAPI